MNKWTNIYDYIIPYSVFDIYYQILSLEILLFTDPNRELLDVGNEKKFIESVIFFIVCSMG